MKLLKSRKVIVLVALVALMLIWASSDAYDAYGINTCPKQWCATKFQCAGINPYSCPKCVESHWTKRQDCTDIDIAIYANNVTRCELATPPAGYDNCDPYDQVVFCKSEGTCANGAKKAAYCCWTGGWPPPGGWPDSNGCWEYSTVCLTYTCWPCTGTGNWETTYEYTARCWND